MDEKKDKTSRIKALGTKAKTNFKDFSKDWKEISIKHPIGTGLLETGGMLYVAALGTMVGMLVTGHRYHIDIIKVR